jgi:hypothetical protein
MGIAIQFFKDIKTDLSTALDPTSDESKEVRNMRIASIALRILGSAVALYTVIALFSAVSLIVASTAIGVILAHDMIKMGCNLHQMIALANLLPAAVSEGISSTPASLQGTWVFEPVYQLATCCAGQVENETSLLDS